MARWQRALDLVVWTVGLLALWHFALGPLYRLLHLGVRPHGTLAEDGDFYYTLVAVGLQSCGSALGVAFSLLGLTCAFSSPLGFLVGEASRVKARSWFWYMPVLWFSVELLGRLQVQRWYLDHGLLFPWYSFLRDFAPHLAWLAAVGIATGPAILTGRGLYLLGEAPGDAQPTA